MRTLCWGVVLVSVLLSETVIAAPAQSSPEKPDLQVFLTAFARGDSAAVLQEAELSVLIDGAPAQLKTVRPAKNDPLLFAILVDHSGSDAHTGESIKEAALQLFQGLRTDQNQGYLVLFNDRIGVSRDGISALQAKQVLDSTRFYGGTAVYDAIEQTCIQKLSRSGNPARRVILLISDGEDDASYATQKRAEEAALREGVSVFALETNDTHMRGDKFLRKLSQETGGFFTDKDFKKAVPAAFAAIDAQSIITFSPTQSTDKNLHAMKIKSTQKDVHISAPNSVPLE